MTDVPRLSDKQLETAQINAARFVDELKAIMQKKNNGFPELFAIAAHIIQTDIDNFCDRASLVLDEIDAYGQEPLLDDDWLLELTGEKDSFYFSTDSLVGTPLTLPRKQRQQQPDHAAVACAVEQAIDQTENVLAIAHAENVQAWIQTIREALVDSPLASFQQLLCVTHLQPTELWLGLLLGHELWSLQQFEFYGSVTVSLRS